MPNTVDSALGKAIKALEIARKLASQATSKNQKGKQARERLDGVLKQLDPLLKMKSLGPDPEPGPVRGEN